MFVPPRPPHTRDGPAAFHLWFEYYRERAGCRESPSSSLVQSRSIPVRCTDIHRMKVLLVANPGQERGVPTTPEESFRSVQVRPGH